MVKWFPNLHLNLIDEKQTVAVIIATFAFTMLGFLAAVITIMFSFAGTRTLKKYKHKGYLDVFFFIYLFAIFSLVITFFLGIIILSSTNASWALRCGLMSTVNNFAQIALLTIIIVNISNKSMNQ